MLTYYIDKKSTVNIKAQINIKADILQFLNGRKKKQSIILFLVKMSGLILVAQNSVKRGLKLLFYHFQHRERFYNTYRYDQNLVKHHSISILSTKITFCILMILRIKI